MGAYFCDDGKWGRGTYTLTMGKHIENDIYILGIESSCDETAAAVVEDGRNVLSNAIASQIEEHKLYGGVVPEIASRRHSEAIVGVTQEALSEAGCTLKDIDAIAVTSAPGLIGALLVGVNFAKGFSLATGLPLVPVHHLRSHIASKPMEMMWLMFGGVLAAGSKKAVNGDL